MRNARLLYDKSESDKLNKLKYKNTHDYWKLLKRASQSAKPNIQYCLCSSAISKLITHQIVIFGKIFLIFLKKSFLWYLYIPKAYPCSIVITLMQTTFILLQDITKSDNLLVCCVFPHKNETNSPESIVVLSN